MKSKEQKVLHLFYNEPSKHWHFREIAQILNLSDYSLNIWLKKLIKENTIVRKKPKGKMPFYQGNYEHPSFFAKKKMYGLNLIAQSGLLEKLASLKATTVIIFGSFARGDWHKESDIDIFTLGKEPVQDFIWNIDTHREVSFQQFNTARDLRSASKLVHNVLNGYVVKGSVHHIL